MTEPAAWAVGAVAVCMMMAAFTFAPDPIAKRIEACMSQPNMEYIDGDCISERVEE